MAKRSCNGCTACCEGWLPGQAKGHFFWPGRKCQFCTSSGCEIYKDRPKDPCIDFNCAWLVDPTIPAWMKPNECGVILQWEKIGDQDCLTAIECGKKMDSAILSWLFLAHVNGIARNIRWFVDGGQNYAGTKEFLEEMKKR